MDFAIRARGPRPLPPPGGPATASRGRIAAGDGGAALKDGQRQAGRHAEVPSQSEAVPMLNLNECSLWSAGVVLERGVPEWVRAPKAARLRVIGSHLMSSSSACGATIGRPLPASGSGLRMPLSRAHGAQGRRTRGATMNAAARTSAAVTLYALADARTVASVSSLGTEGECAGAATRASAALARPASSAAPGVPLS